MLTNDRKITISAAGNRKATRWPAQTLYWSEFVERLKTPVRGVETLNEYLHMPKSKQDDLKDVGGFVGGLLKDGRRKANSVVGRDIITLDLDRIPAGGTQDILRRIEALGCAYVVYSTRKHEEAKPRLRVIIPGNRTITADEYEPLARKLASIIGIELCDPSTFEASRLMYWPSCCSDTQYVYQYGDKPFLDVDGLLATYKDWRSVAEWPEVSGTRQAHIKLAAKQGDPTTKSGVVGAFCRIYDIYKAMDTFLPGVYTPCDDKPDRYTYTGGSTTGGAIVYDNGTFLYSHHATDPASGRLVNAFDLVRLHKFADDRDDEAKPGTLTHNLPSYTAMCKLAVADPQVTTLLNQERYEKATQDFSVAQDDAANWISKLQVSPSSGAVLKSTKNIRLCLENDPLLKGRIRLNTFADRLIGVAPLPWGKRANSEGIFEWGEADDAGIRDYIQQTLNIKSKDLVDDAVILTAQTNSFDPVKAYLTATQWDGIPRLDTLYIDYLGAEDCPYVRAITRKAFTAAVARVMTPGTKFDTMTVMEGPQGIGKTTLFAKMGGEWFSNSLVTFEGKEAAELLQGVWIIEVGELEAYSKSDIRLVKQFLSKTDDQYRAAYTRRTEKHPRRCVFFGTTNNAEYLRDPTGNRRFWPVEVTKGTHKKDVHEDLDPETVAQVWAEAVMRWRLGEPLILSKELEEEANQRREAHTERDPLQGQIEAFLDRPIPEDWQTWDATRRAMYWSGSMRQEIRTVPRDRVCVSEIWQECLGNRFPPTKGDSHRITEILNSIKGWERCGIQRFGNLYGRQKAFKRVNNVTVICQPKGGFVNHIHLMEVNHVNLKNEKVDIES